MATVKVRGLPELLSSMDDLARNQAPFAIAKAMTATVRQAKAAEDKYIPQVFDKPTPFTQRAVAFTGATKAKLTASVFIKDVQAKYLEAEAEGGKRQFKSFEQQFASSGPVQVALPARGTPLNQYGNLTKAKIKSIAASLNKTGKKQKFFLGVPKGHTLPLGIYARMGSSLVPVLVFASSANYQKRFKFDEVGTATITAEFPSNLTKAWDEAVRTARR